jgi:hypothetical protein
VHEGAVGKLQGEAAQLEQQLHAAAFAAVEHNGVGHGWAGSGRCGGVDGQVGQSPFEHSVGQSGGAPSVGVEEPDGVVGEDAVGARQ